MKRVLLTGANGYIGKRLLPVLLQQYEVYCAVRDKNRFQSPFLDHQHCHVLELDFLKPETLKSLPEDLDGAYFLMHSMSSSSNNDFEIMESQMAQNFVNAIEQTNINHVVYLGSINNDRKETSKHLSSRENVEKILATGSFNTTTLGAGIIIGSGSSSFEIMRDLVEKLPLMIAPKWLLTQSQYIAVKNVIQYLEKVLFYEPAYEKKFDIFGPNVMTYREMLLSFSNLRKLKRWIIQVPVLSPKLSSYWLYFVTSTSFSLARSLVASMRVEVIGNQNTLHKELKIELLSFREAVSAAFVKIEQNNIVSSWKDSGISGRLILPIEKYINVPTHGCFFDKRIRSVQDVNSVVNKIWAIGGNTGWYYGSWLWNLRGILDKMVGGVGLRRGRTNLQTITTGDALDFWRVILADKSNKRLLLYAEMRLPGEAWLEFKINDQNEIHQTATFRPRGLWGRLYWYLVMPFHSLIFNGMANKIAA